MRARISSLTAGFDALAMVLYRLVEPGADDRQRFLGMRVDDFTDLLDGGFADLTFDLADVDRWAARRGSGRLAAARVGRCAGAGRGQAPATGEDLPSWAGAIAPALLGANMRAISGRATKKPISSAVTHRIATSMILNQSGPSRPSSGLGAGVASPVSSSGESHIVDLHHVAALGVEADGGFHQIGDLLHLGGDARRVGACRRRRDVPSTTTATESRFTSPPSLVLVFVGLGRSRSWWSLRCGPMHPICVPSAGAELRRRRAARWRPKRPRRRRRWCRWCSARRSGSSAPPCCPDRSSRRRGAGAVVIHVGRHLDADMAGADDAGDDGFDALAQTILEIGGASDSCRWRRWRRRRSCRRRRPADRPCRRRWRRAPASGRKPRRRRDAGSPATWPRPSTPRVFSTTEAVGVWSSRRKDLPFGNDQMHARAFDAVDGLDGAGEFAFQGAQAVDVLDEGGGAEGVRLVEDLIADAGGGQVVLRQLPCAAWSPDRREPGSCRHRPWLRI